MDIFNFILYKTIINEKTIERFISISRLLLIQIKRLHSYVSILQNVNLILYDMKN